MSQYIHIRLYEELNDHVSPGMRKRTFDAPIQKGWRVADVLARLGVPEMEVELVLLNSSPADFSSTLSDGDRLAVYPMFEAFDITATSGLRDAPLRSTRFVADVHLGKLARYLRALGFDTLYEKQWDDDELAGISEEQGRILLTRDRGLAMRKSLIHCLTVMAEKPSDQLAEVMARLDLGGLVNPFTRCVVCNGQVERVMKEEVRELVPERTFGCYSQFHQCQKCRKVYWPGASHARLKKVLGRAGAK